MVLLALLALAIGAYAYDYFVAKPGCDEANKKLHEFVEQHNKKGVQEAALVTMADVQKALGRAPTMVVEQDDKGATLEYYCWWGNVPLLNRRRHFIAVVYVGNKPRHYSSHYQEEPPADAYPIPSKQSADEIAGSSSGAEGAPAEGEAKPKGSDKPSDGEKKEGEGEKKESEPAAAESKEKAEPAKAEDAPKAAGEGKPKD